MLPVATIRYSQGVGRRLWQAFESLAERHPGLHIVVADGTRLFIDAADLASLARRGAHLAAWRAIRLVGMTTSPFSPWGGHLDATELLAAARAAFPGQVVNDVVLEAQTPDRRHGPVAA